AEDPRPRSKEWDMSPPLDGAPHLAERIRRWRLALGDDDTTGLNDRDRRIEQALAGLYGAVRSGGGRSGDGRRRGGPERRAGLGGSAPQVARWLGYIREFFPAGVVQ